MIDDELLTKIEATATAAKCWWNSYTEAGEWDTYENTYSENSDLTNFIQTMTPEIALEMIKEMRAIGSDILKLSGERMQLITDNQLLQSNVDDAMKTITLQAAELARLRTELAAKSPPPAVAPYHRLAFEAQLIPCVDCSQDAVDRYLLPDGTFKDLCRACAEEQQAILAD